MTVRISAISRNIGVSCGPDWYNCQPVSNSDSPSRRCAPAGVPTLPQPIPSPVDAGAYRTLAELLVNAGRVLTYEHLLRRVWGLEGDADVRPMRTAVSSIRRKLGDSAADPTYLHRALRWLPDAQGGDAWTVESESADLCAAGS